MMSVCNYPNPPMHARKDASTRAAPDRPKVVGF